MDRVELLSENMIKVIKSKTPAERLQNAFRLSNLARARLEAYLRHRHPHWNDTQVKQEIAKKIANGSE